MKKKSFFQMSSERFNAMMAILIVTVALFTSLVLLIQHEGGMRTAVYRRDANRYAIQAMRVRSAGETRAGYDVNVAYQSWVELDLLAQAADKAGDKAAAERYRSVQAQMVKLSPLLDKKYFGEKRGEPDIAGYEADAYLVEATKLSERAALWFAVGEVWDGKADAAITHLSLLAVALALYGLSVALSSRVRWMFMLTGSAIFILTIYWVAEVYLKPVPMISEPAIDAYAQGFGLSYRGDHAAALKAFDQALAAKDDYANAYYERGNTRFALRDYARALDDYRAAKKNGKDDPATNTDLGWTLYLLGNFGESADASKRALELNPTLSGAQLNLALAQLAAGEADAARKTYTAAMDAAAKQVADTKTAGKEPPSSLWLALDDGTSDLGGLLARAQNRVKSWHDAPPRETIKDTNAVASIAPEIEKQLKNLTLALEYTGKPATGAMNAKISALKFGVSDGKTTKFTEKIPLETKEVVVAFDYSEMEKGKRVIVRVYRDGAEDLSLRLVDEWSGGTAGKIEIPVGAGYSGVYTLPAGEYVVEVYVDYRWVQSGTFVVQ